MFKAHRGLEPLVLTPGPVLLPRPRVLVLTSGPHSPLGELPLSQGFSDGGQVGEGSIFPILTTPPQTVCVSAPGTELTGPAKAAVHPRPYSTMNRIHLIYNTNMKGKALYR